MPRHPVEVRPATAGDVDVLVGLWAQARQELVDMGRHVPVVAADAVRARLLEALTDHHVDVLLARTEGEAVGFAVLRTASLNPLAPTPVVQVEQLFVSAEARRRGVGRALVAATASAADRAGVDQVVCNVVPGARATHRFWARLGFAPMVVRRGTSVAALRRRLVSEGRRPVLEDVLARRRTLQARLRSRPEDVPPAELGPAADGVA
ncbi:MAG: GNAT family N-acetyltransferase [Kineosporiaceae bacterium]